MKTFILDADHNITVYASPQEASRAIPGGKAFSTAAGLREALKNHSAAARVGIWNSLTGVAPVRRFQDSATAARRIFAELEKLGSSIPVVPDAPGTKQARAAGTRQVKAPQNAAKKAVIARPRENSKIGRLIGMLRTRDRVTLDEICRTFGWQPHTARALMSAGGSLAKKHGISVISEKSGGARTYRIGG